MEPVFYSSKLNLPPPAYGMSQDNDQISQLMDNQIQVSQSTVITVEDDEPPVRDHLVWSIFNTVYMNFCCLGFLALVFSVKSRDRKNVGDKQGAMSYSSTARGLNIATTILFILTFIIQIVVVLYIYL
ncbi:dispanin subfamily A member 2b isoform X4 [Xenopus laevis]|uniref:Dispanin subfamily A member 2b isoform X4 n=2 Tax=Xenopus laevis TaxID=8355 RepID=A0A1L8GJ93_XENLA|nr:dispanin subfamily A member 2b isoform X4 [Xenopus laevis]OCT83907.1 hypothetical protein XELAEV_18022046mg [Xenopus laevis]